MDLRFVQCPYCLKPFEEGDDVVVCPDCGTPGHRACWKEQGHCLYENKHASGFVWEIPYSKEREEADRKAREEEAARKRAATFGAGAGEPDTRPDGLPFDNEYGNYASYTTGDHGEMRPTMRVIGPEEMLGDYRVREYGDVIGRNKNKYIPRFFVMDRTKRNFTGNFAAFFFPILWSAYRRMYGVALVLILAHFIVPLFALDSVVEYYNEAYRLVQEYALSSADQGTDAMQEAFNALSEKLPMPPVALQINRYVTLAISLLMGMFGNTIYKRHCETILRKSKDLEGPEQQAEFRKRRGGTSIIAAILVAAIAFTLLNFVVSFSMRQGYTQDVAEQTTKAAEAVKEALITLRRN